MSTRHERAADKSQNEKHLQILKAMLQRPENKICADCRKKDPRWVSWNLGVFICIRCSGIHRSMGTHISKVKSVDLDTWTPEQIAHVQRWGNATANKYWEANLTKEPTESTIDQWIRAKYDRRQFAMQGPMPEPEQLSGQSAANQLQQNQQPPAQQVTPKMTPTGTPNFGPISSPAPTSMLSNNGANAAISRPAGSGSPAQLPPPQAGMSPRPGNPQQQQQQQQVQPQQPDFKSTIMSLYGAQPSHQAQQPAQQFNIPQGQVQGQQQQQVFPQVAQHGQFQQGRQAQQPAMSNQYFAGTGHAHGQQSAQQARSPYGAYADTGGQPPGTDFFGGAPFAAPPPSGGFGGKVSIPPQSNPWASDASAVQNTGMGGSPAEQRSPNPSHDPFHSLSGFGK